MDRVRIEWNWQIICTQTRTRNHVSHYACNRHHQTLFFCGKCKSIHSYIWKVEIKAANSTNECARVGLLLLWPAPNQHWIMEIARTIFKSTETGNSLINLTEFHIRCRYLRVCIRDCIGLNENKLEKCGESCAAEPNFACDDVDWIVSIVFVFSEHWAGKFYSFNQMHALFSPPKTPELLYRMKLLFFGLLVNFWSGHVQNHAVVFGWSTNVGRVDWSLKHITEIQSKSIFRPFSDRERRTKTETKQKVSNVHQLAIRNMERRKLGLRWKEVNVKW